MAAKGGVGGGDQGRCGALGFGHPFRPAAPSPTNGLETSGLEAPVQVVYPLQRTPSNPLLNRFANWSFFLFNSSHLINFGVLQLIQGLEQKI